MIIALMKDLFFVSKIDETAKQLKKKVKFISNIDEINQFLGKNKNNNNSNEINRDENIDLIIVDLNFDEINPLEIIKNLKGKENFKNKKIIAYCSHVQIDLMNNAKNLGAEVMPRSLFTSELIKVIKN